MRSPEDFPKVPLGLFPTPCYPLEAISARYGRDIWIKRDDLCGVALGGNKVRKLEYLLAEARKGGCDTVFTTGSAQSNHAALTAACAARLGMKCVLFLKGRGAADLRGNLALDRLFGAEIRFVDTDQYAQIYDEMLALDEELSKQGRKCRAIPAGGSTPLGALGYVACAQEIAAQCDTVFTTGAAQSNHAMLTAACAARLGMRCVLFLKKRGVTDRRGNLVLDELYGAEVRLMDMDRYSQIYDAMLEEEERLSAEGHKCFAIPVGGSNPLGAVGYVGCVDEIAIQCPNVEHIVSATGSGGTTAGLLLGAKMYLPDVRVTGIAVDDDPFEEIVPSLAEEAAGLLDFTLDLQPGDLRIAPHIGEGYGIPNPADTPLIEELARKEGILLDPIYTGKAWAGMLELLKGGAFPGDGSIVFVHTGGAAALFAYDLPRATCR